MKEGVFRHPLNIWAIRIVVEAEELWDDIRNIFGLFDECGIVEKMNSLKGDFVIKRKQSENGVYMLYNNNQKILVSGKEEILGHLGQIYYLPFYLKTEAVTYFHGGCLLSQDETRTYLFLAPTGTGKTTIISFLLANGYHYFSDDIIPVQERGLTVFSFPKALYVRNTEFVDSFNHKGLIFNTGTKLSLSEERKCVYSVKNKTLKTMSDVAGIFILDRQEKYSNVQLERINGQDSFFELMKNLKDPENMSNSYLSVAYLVKNVEIFRLKYGNGIQQLEDIMEVLSGRGTSIVR